MIIGRIRGANFCYTAPPELPDCQDLHVRTQVINGCHTASSAWFPTPEELAALNAGQPVIFTHWGNGHPVVSLTVEPPEPFDAT